MRRFLKVFFLLCFCSVIMCCCSRKNTKPVYRAVTQIDIVTKYENKLLRRHYTSAEKMRPVLLYLRLLKPYGQPAQLPESGDDIYLISITLSDGQRHYYRQAGHRYLSVENGPFKPIDPGQASHLYTILRAFPSDG